MLLNNYAIENFMAAGRPINAFSNSYGAFRPESWRSVYIQDAVSVSTNKTASYPTGTENPYNFVLPFKGGELSSTIGMAGTGAVTPNLTLNVGIEATMAGSGSMTANANLTIALASSMAGSGAMSSNLTGIANLECEILVNPGGATADTIAAAVWDTEAAEHDTAGTFGEKLNDAGSAGNPWTDTTTYGAGTKGKLLQDALSTNKFIALK